MSVALWDYAATAPQPVHFTGSPAPAAAFKVNLNRARPDRLRLLPGIGPVTARAIVDYRDKHGPFSSLQNLRNVPGIGQGKVNAICDYVKLSDEN